MSLTCQNIFLCRIGKNIWNNVVIIIYRNMVIPNLFHLLCYHVIHCKNPSSVKWFLLIIEQYMHLRQEHIWILLNLPHFQSTVSHTSNFSVLAVNWCGISPRSMKSSSSFVSEHFSPWAEKYSVGDAWSAHE